MEPSFLGKVSLSTSPHSSPTEPAPRKKRFLIGTTIMVTVIILLALACALLLVHHRTSKEVASSASPSLTLYYDDNKTVLYHRDSQDAVKSQAPYFVNMVEAQLERQYGQDYLNKGSWSVTTTLDNLLQLSAEKLAASQNDIMKSQTGGVADEIAAIVQDVKTGQIRVLVGGTDAEGAVNYADTPLAGGSSMIPFSYAALINNTTTTGAGSPINDTQAPLPGYPCADTGLRGGAPDNCAYDADLIYPGTLSLRYALGGNRRVPAIEAMLGAAPEDKSYNHITSIKKTVQLIDDMSAPNAYQCYADQARSKPAQCYEASAAGDGAYITLLDELHGFSTIANNGIRTPQTMITSVRLNGKAQALPRQPKSTPVIKPDTAYILNNILSDPNASYLPGSCTAKDCTYITEGGYKFQRLAGWDLAVDPGTTIDGYGATMASWSTHYAAITWAGNSNQNKAISVPGENFTEPLTREMMQETRSGKEPENWQQPKDIQTLPAFIVTQHIHYGDVEPSPSTDIYPAWYKQQ